MAEKIKFTMIDKNNLVAKAEVEISKGVWLKDFMLIRGKEGKIFCNPPSRAYQDNKTNTTKYASYLSFDEKEVYFSWMNKIVEAYNAKSMADDSGKPDDDDSEFKTPF